MTQDQIHQLFKQSYNQANWKQFLGETFTQARLLPNPEVLTSIDTNVASKALKLGYVSLDENGLERQIAVYEVILEKGIILERNRVGLRNLLRRYWKNIDAAFIIYHNPDSKKWRFTYVSELTGYDTEGNFQKIQTEPKRYTYVLGEGESTRTAAERFAIIAKKGSRATLDDVKEAFSVEKLSRAFFDEYKKHYDLFCDFMVKKPGIKSTIFNGDEKGIRDFNKKLLGRIVFLYFIQKKGWMGVPAGSKWGQGDFNFLDNLFSNHKNPDLFYSEMLTRLFFDTLNTKRDGDVIELVKGQPCRIPYLNGGLFEEDDKKHRNIILNAELFRNLFGFFSQYNFTIYEDDPNDHTVAVDPEMLGHIFENLLEDNKDKGAFYTPKEIVHYMCQESLIEYLTTWFENNGYAITGYVSLDNPNQPALFSANEGRIGQGVIEITNQVSGKNIDRMLIEKLLKKKLDDDDKKLVKEHANEFHKALDEVKICDPAIGSGAFPMGLLQEIFTAKQTLRHFEHGNLKGFPASDVKLNIIQNSIYGVDIEKGAVDIARLRFWLSLVVDEEEPKALPNLDYKIVVGNSLVSKLDDTIIDIDWEVKENKAFQSNIFGSGDLLANKGKLLKKISEEQREFFNPESDKKKLASDIRKLKIDLLINQLELMVTTKGIENKPNGTGRKLAEQTARYLQTIGWKDSVKELKKLKDQPDKSLNHFDWKLDFPEIFSEYSNESVGFDIVIGNPPYIGEKGNKVLFDQLKQGFLGKYYIGKIDIFYLFFHLGIEKLKTKGVLSFITTNYFLTADGGKLLRKELKEKTSLIKLVNFNELKVFNSAKGQHNIVTMFSKTRADRNCEIIISNHTGGGNATEIVDLLSKKSNSVISYSSMSSKLFESSNNYIRLKATNSRYGNNNNIENIIDKVRIESSLLGDICFVNIGMRTGADKVSPKHLVEFNLSAQKGEGIYVLSKDEVETLNLNSEEYNLLLPFFKNSDIRKYKVKEKNDLFLIGTVFPNLKTLDEGIYPNIHAHLNRFKDVLVNRKSNDNGLLSILEKGHWWAFTMRQLDFNAPKIVSPQRSNINTFGYTETSWYASMDVYYITQKSPKFQLKYILALLNSKLYYHWFYIKGKRKGNSLELYQTPLSEVPIRNVDIEIQRRFTSLVDRIIFEKMRENDTKVLEENINTLVYLLYKLTYDEVKEIDLHFALSKSEYEEGGEGLFGESGRFRQRYKKSHG